MSESPERIWARVQLTSPRPFYALEFRTGSQDTEYIRADIHEARLKALGAKIEEILYENIHPVRGDVAGVDDALSLILQALKTE